MAQELVFTVPFETDRKTGKPRLKPPTNERHRSGKYGSHYTDKQTERDREVVMFYAREAIRQQPDFELMTGAVMFTLIAYFTPPPSWSKKKQEQAIAGKILPTVVPDFDNIAKLVADSLGMKRKKKTRPQIPGIVYHDDAQITDHIFQKRYDAHGTRLLCRFKDLS